jgi:hypothetical protein
MKKTYILSIAFIFAVLLAFNFISCDDTGIATPRNESTFQPTNLKRLEPGQGYYEVFVCFDDIDSNSITMGKFNMSNDGLQTVDSLDNPVALKLRHKPYKIELATKIILTLEPEGDYDTIPGIRLMGGLVTQTDALIMSDMNMRFPEAFGSLLDSFIFATGSAILNTPTTDTTSDWFKGVWFCDTAQPTQQALLNLAVLPGTLRWQYEGWIYDGTSYFSTGKFIDRNIADFDRAGPNAGPNLAAAYNKPGQDIILAPTDLRGGNVKLLITLEPNNESTNGKTIPSGLNIFYFAPIGNKNIGEIFNLPNIALTLPTAKIQITKE